MKPREQINRTGRFHTWFNSKSEASSELESEGVSRMDEEGRTVQGAED